MDVAARKQLAARPERRGRPNVSFLRHGEIYRYWTGSQVNQAPRPSSSMSFQSAIPRPGCAPAEPGLRFANHHHHRGEPVNCEVPLMAGLRNAKKSLAATTNLG